MAGKRARQGEVSETVLQLMRDLGRPESVANLRVAASQRLGWDVNRSTVQSYLLNHSELFEKTARGLYSLREGRA